MAILAELISDDVLDTAYVWLCTRRRAYPADADVWSFRQRWPAEKKRLTAELAMGRFRFGLLTRVTLKYGEEVDLWSARDALVLKALALVLGEHLPISPRCTHVKGHGGAKAAVRQVWVELAENRFVLRTDVKSYYASIDHFLLLDQLAEYVKDRRVLNLLGQYLRRTAERGGQFWDYEKGISLGCPLSPLMGALFLKCLDQRMEKSGLFYVRFMDDILVLSPTRWKLRKAVKVVNGMLGSLGLEKHPDKTFIGRIEKGFDLPLLSLPARRAILGPEDRREFRRPCDPALRARAGGGPKPPPGLDCTCSGGSGGRGVVLAVNHQNPVG